MTEMNKINFEALKDLANLAVLFVAAGFEVTLFGRELIATREGVTVAAFRNYSEGTVYAFGCYAVDATKEEVTACVQAVTERRHGRRLNAASVVEDEMSDRRSTVVELWNHDHSKQEIRGALERAGLLEL